VTLDARATVRREERGAMVEEGLVWWGPVRELRIADDLEKKDEMVAGGWWMEATKKRQGAKTQEKRWMTMVFESSL